jgi:CRP-like cAMP-binding protein
VSTPPFSRLLDALDDADRRDLLAHTVRRRFARGDTLFHEGDPGDTLHLVEKGHVAIKVTTPLGDVAMLTVHGPGEAFGEHALLDARAARTASAVALTPVETRALHRDEFEALRRLRPAVDRFLVDALAAQVRRLSVHLTEALYVAADTRVLRRLVSLADQFGDGDDGVVVPITQEDLAAMAGTTRPTANRVLKSAESAGAVRVARGRVEIADHALLQKLAR